MANRRSLRRRQSVGEDSLNTTTDFQRGSRLTPPPPSEETHDGKDSASIRPEKVSRGKELVRDENYPPREVIDSVATLLAKHLQRGDER
jgi:hypothetical protein